ncbi:MAG: hypothetical protein CMP48_17410 [Rickettsiales bacterium]|nr:hypothetical protein [Rickettsiales bacterium]
MRVISYLFERLKRWFHSDRLRIKKGNDVPKKVKRNTIHLVGKEDPWLMVFLCPCGCGDELRLNMMEEEYPCWSLKIEGKLIDVFPSINRVRGCKSHFWIKKSKVKWY